MDSVADRQAPATRGGVSPPGDTARRRHEPVTIVIAGEPVAACRRFGEPASGQFEVYDIAGNTLVGAASLGAVGLDWQLGGFAPDPPTGSMGCADAIGGGSGAADGLNSGFVTAETLQQPLLTTPQHA